jgi:hypothetical protein
MYRDAGREHRQQIAQSARRVLIPERKNGILMPTLAGLPTTERVKAEVAQTK